jgi:hypothetical protein
LGQWAAKVAGGAVWFTAIRGARVVYGAAGVK